MDKLYTWLAVGIVVAITATCAPEHLREQGRQEERDKRVAASNAATTKRDIEFDAVTQQLASERAKNAQLEIAHNEKFNAYVADVRAGRVPGLRIGKDRICPARSEETTAARGNEENATVRLPREIEENLFRFADDRDQIIMAFEAFKTEVRTAKCFAD